MHEGFFKTRPGEFLGSTYARLVVRALVDKQTPPSPDYFLTSNAKIAATLSPQNLWQTRRDLRGILMVAVGRPKTPEQEEASLRILMEESYDEGKALEFHRRIQDAAKKKNNQ